VLKVMTIVGTRPELIKMSRVIAAVERQTRHVLVHTGQNSDYELNQIFFDELGIRKPDHFLDVSGGNAAQTIARVIERSDEVFGREQPDALLLYGDTNSCLAVIAAKRRKIPVFHMEAGNRCFDERVPEELNRKVVDHLSDINLVLSEHARRYLISEGIRPETVIKTGSHMPEVLSHYHDQIEASDVLVRLGLQEKRYFLVSAHREENVDSPELLAEVLDSLNALAEAYDYPIIVSTHPRTRQRLEARDGNALDRRIAFHKPFGFFDYLLGFPAVTIRNVHERPEGMDAGTLIMSGLERKSVLDAVRVVIDQQRDGGQGATPIADYDNLEVSRQVVRVVLSYVGYVNRRVWRR
jgi:UDP-N-acetylglucosamine 2-epimerase